MPRGDLYYKVVCVRLSFTLSPDLAVMGKKSCRVEFLTIGLQPGRQLQLRLAGVCKSSCRWSASHLSDGEGTKEFATYFIKRCRSAQSLPLKSAYPMAVFQHCVFSNIYINVARVKNT